MKQISNIRKAYASKGDDVTLTRFVKEPGRHKSGRTATAMPSSATRTRFLSRVLPVSEMKGLLVSGHSNVKVGRDVRKGLYRGYWIYTLSLEERATCPTSCLHWRDCYGNSMPFAKRIRHDDPAFLPALERDLEELLAMRGRVGVLVRLHALGDFYSTKYVAFWDRMLRKHPRLAIYGYTARRSGTAIGRQVNELNKAWGRRCMIRFSDGGHTTMSTLSIVSPEDRPANAFVCPEQTGQTRCCATCGACWSTDKNVAFLAH